VRIGITGATGLIGWHTRCRLLAESDVEVLTCGRTEFESESELDRFVSGCDAIFHFAGMNRGSDADIEAVNRGLAEKLVEAMERSDRRPVLVFSSSTHIDRDSAYGRSKRAASRVFSEWADRRSGVFVDLVLPHVFGECGRPFYNSVVSTFCHQIAAGEDPLIESDGELELLHAREVAELSLSAARHGLTAQLRPSGRRMLVSEMLRRVSELARTYEADMIPPLEDGFDLSLFNTYRSYLFPGHYPRPLKLHSDRRGSLFEAVKTQHGGQAFLSSTRPGFTRGEHFHFAKVERFLVVQGDAVIRLRRMFDDRIVEFRVSGDEPGFIDMPTLHTHNITNVGDGDLLTFFWSHEVFDPQAPDTVPAPVIQAEASHG
jgi:UDP-2-acetamido-2,6-beta-L-arabino-hexul-4-ose reductase